MPAKRMGADGGRKEPFGTGDHRSHQRIVQSLRDLGREHPGPHVVLAQHRVRPVLFGAADGNEHRGRSGSDTVAQLGQVNSSSWTV